MALRQRLVTLIFVLMLSAAGCDQSTAPEQENEPPSIAAVATVYASGGIYFSHRPQIVDPDDSTVTVTFPYLPTWVVADADSIYGVPPDTAGNDSIKVIVSDGELADSAVVPIRLLPPLVVYGDTRTGHDAHRRVVGWIQTVHPSTVFHVGDLVNDGTLQSDWDIFNEIVADMLAQSEFFPALGNHEYQSQLFFDNFELPGNEQWYSVVRNRVHFIILNSCVDIGPGSDQYQWLHSDLASVADSIWYTAVVFHHPPYSTGAHAEDELGLRDILVPVFEQYGVDIVFTGHDHDYERSHCGGIFYIVTGGGGAPLRDQARQHPCSDLFLKQYHFCKLSVLPDEVHTKVFNDSGIVIDSFVVSR